MALYNNQPFIDEGTKGKIMSRIVSLDQELAKDTPSEEVLATEQAAWEASTQKIMQTREAELKRQQEVLAAEEETVLKKLEQEKQAETDSLQKELATLKEDLQRYETELSGLGFFGFSKKKACKENIEKTATLIESTKVKLSEVESDFERNISLQKDAFQKQMAALPEKIATDNPFTISPRQRFAVLDYLRQNWPVVLEEKAAGSDSLSRTKAAHLEVECYILIILEQLGCAVTVAPIAEILNYILDYAPYNDLPNLMGEAFAKNGTISNQRAAAETRLLMDRGIVERTEVEGKGFFSIKNA